MYRTEQDALDALVLEQRKTNELLEKILERGMANGLHQNTEGTDENPAGSKRNIHRESDKDGALQPIKGASQSRSRRNT